MQAKTTSRFITTISVPAESLPPAASPEEVPEAAAPEANRKSCPLITGTDYLSTNEREWYIANCMTKAAQASLASVSPVTTNVVAPAASRGSTIELFIAGYRDAGGPEAYLDRIVSRVIPCESGGNPSAVNRGGPYYGLMQFSAGTWRSVGGGDWFDPYTQGVNTARLLSRASPANQWPACWNR